MTILSSSSMQALTALRAAEAYRKDPAALQAAKDEFTATRRGRRIASWTERSLSWRTGAPALSTMITGSGSALLIAGSSSGTDMDFILFMGVTVGTVVASMSLIQRGSHNHHLHHQYTQMVENFGEEEVRHARQALTKSIESDLEGHGFTIVDSTSKWSWITHRGVVVAAEEDGQLMLTLNGEPLMASYAEIGSHARREVTSLSGSRLQITTARA